MLNTARYIDTRLMIYRRITVLTIVILRLHCAAVLTNVLPVAARVTRMRYVIDEHSVFRYLG